MAESSELAIYELPLPQADQPGVKTPSTAHRVSLPRPILIKNVLWFCQLRWLAIGMLGAFGMLGLVGEVFPDIGLHDRREWALLVAGVLLLANIALLLHARQGRRSPETGWTEVNLWGQIVLDLLALTVVVHFVGSTVTFIPFVYLFHVVLACIFFSRRQSLAVMLLACTLYAACIAIEWAGVVAPQVVFGDLQSPDGATAAPVLASVNFCSVLAIFPAVWYLTSHLAAMVRQRDAELAETNLRLIQAREERTRHMLHTTHELKAPFAAIHANAQLLTKGYCGALPAEAMAVAKRISTRCRRLAEEIQEMLQLANLSSVGQAPARRGEVDLVELLNWSISRVEPTARERAVEIEREFSPARTCGVEGHLKMLLANVLANAVSYSYPAGRIRVRCGPDERGGAVVSVADEGIGIEARKLPHIFDEYYRTSKAQAHNQESTGLGLPIVREVAQAHAIAVRVESRAGQGTRFELRFPGPADGPGAE